MTLPLDMRKGSAFPASAFEKSERLCLERSGGVASELLMFGTTERQSLSAHQAAKPQRTYGLTNDHSRRFSRPGA